MKYELMKIKDIIPYIYDMERLKVSEKARTSGFLYNYFTYGKKMLKMPSDQPHLTWEQKRDLFIVRTLKAYEMKPTYRRFLSLIGWAFMPNIYYAE